jgi:hypothetical protein
VSARDAAALRRRFTIAVLASEILRDAARALGAAGIPVMPLKGVLFQRVLYADPAERLMSDVDVLVPEHQFGQAITTLMAAGFRPQKIGRSLIEVALSSPKGLAVDLHRRLFGFGRYRLSTEGVFRRASPDESLFGVPLHIAHPHDTAAHLIGKLVSDHVVADASPRLEELARWAAHSHIEPAQLAQHLALSGLGRAARYTCALGTELIGGSFFPALLQALPADRVGHACARLARTVIPRLDGTPLAPVAAHLLNDSLPKGGASALLALRNRWRHTRLERHGERSPGDWAALFGPAGF